MTIKELEEIFIQNQNPEKQLSQEAYLRNQFKFLGIPKSIRSTLEKDFLKDNKSKSADEVVQMAKELHNKEQREYMYTAQQLLLASSKSLKLQHIYQIVELTKIKSWWENTDGYNSIIRNWLKNNSSQTKIFIEKYYQDENFWVRRLSIICQLGLKDATDFNCLQKTIDYNKNDSEFFIQKAIGWALRDYSKNKKKEVEEYLIRNKKKLSKLAVREASKYL